MAAKCILLSSVSRHLDGAVECVVDCHVMSLSDITRHWHCTAIPIDPQFASQWICHQFFKPQIFLLKSWKNCFQFLIQRAIHSYKHLNELSQNLNCSRQEETQSSSLREKESSVCVAGDVSPEMSGEMMDPMLETCHIAHRPGQATRDNVGRPGPPPPVWCRVWYPPVAAVEECDVEWEQKLRFISDWDKAGRRPWETSVKD